MKEVFLQSVTLAATVNNSALVNVGDVLKNLGGLETVDLGLEHIGLKVSLVGNLQVVTGNLQSSLTLDGELATLGHVVELSNVKGALDALTRSNGDKGILREAIVDDVDNTTGEVWGTICSSRSV